MKEKTEIHAVELVRRIRDEQAELLEGKSQEEIIAFFRRAGESRGSGKRSGEHPRFAPVDKAPRP